MELQFTIFNSHSEVSNWHFPNVTQTVSPTPSLEIKKTLKVYCVTFISRNTSAPFWGKKCGFEEKLQLSQEMEENPAKMYL